MNDENIFKQKLYQHTLPVRESNWDAIEAKLPPVEKRKRFAFFWLVLFGSILASGALMLNAVQQNDSLHKPSENHPASSLAEANQASSDPSSDGTRPAPAATSDGSSAIQSPALTESTLKNQNAPNSNDLLTRKSGSTSTSPSKSQSKPSSVSQAERLRPGTSEPIDAKTLFSSIDPSSVYSTDANTLFAENPTLSNPASMARVNRVTTPLPGAEVELDDDDFIPFSLFQPDPECYVFGGYATGFALSADVLAGPGFSVRSFEDTGGESQSYADARNDTERKQYAWTFGARINLHLHSGLGAKLGLSYHQAGDILDYRDSLATQSSTRIDSFWASDGTFLYADTVRVFIPGTLVKKIHNTYRQLDIPLLLSYELILARSIIMINAGPVFNLTSRHSGQILDTSLHPRPLAPDGTPANQVNAYRNQLGISLYLGAGVLFPLGSHTSAVIEPRFLYRIKPVTLPQYALKEHRHFAGLHLGLRYHFN